MSCNGGFPTHISDIDNLIESGNMNTVDVDKTHRLAQFLCLSVQLHIRAAPIISPEHQSKFLHESYAIPARIWPRWRWRLRLRWSWRWQ